MQTLGEKRRVCVFNLDKERELYDFAGELSNFSQFVKRCLTAELQRRREMEQRTQLTVNLGEGDTV